jgi:hypothetical protein
MHPSQLVVPGAIGRRYVAHVDRTIWINTACGSGLNDGVRFPTVAEFCSYFLWRPAYLTLVVVYLGVKRPEHEAGDSYSSSFDIKNTWNYTTTIPHTSWRGAAWSSGTTFFFFTRSKNYRRNEGRVGRTEKVGIKTYGDFPDVNVVPSEGGCNVIVTLMM